MIRVKNGYRVNHQRNFAANFFNPLLRAVRVSRLNDGGGTDIIAFDFAFALLAKTYAQSIARATVLIRALNRWLA